MNITEYFTPPPNHVFDEIKKAAIELCQEHDDAFGLITKKTDRIKSLTNVKDNAWFIVAMFDHFNQTRLINKVSKETAEKIKDALEFRA